MIQMEVVGVALEPNSNRPLVWLKDKDQRMFLPIAIGTFEATAIHMELCHELPPRPITYDLLRSILEGLNVEVSRVTINALRDDTFYAEISLTVDGEVLEIDSRPSDAIALALRSQAPIYVEKSVISEAGLAVEGKAAGPEGIDLEEIQGRLEPVGEHRDGRGRPSRAAAGSLGQVEQRVVTLKARLQDAVAREEYEEAAKLRDEIGRLEDRGT